MKKILVVSLIVIIILIAWLIFPLNYKPKNSGIACAGFAGKQCPKGYVCAVKDKYPDALGSCYFSLRAWIFDNLQKK